MKRSLIATVLIMVVLAVAAAPAFAYLDSQGAGSAATAAPTVAIPHAGFLSVAAAQGRTAPVAMFRGRGMRVAMVPVGYGGTGVAITLLLAVVIGGAVYAMATGRRQTAAKSVEPARLPAFKANADREREAA